MAFRTPARHAPAPLREAQEADREREAAAQVRRRALELERELATLEHYRRQAAAPTDLLAFAQEMMLDPADPAGHATLYEIRPHHRMIAEHLEKLFNGEITKLCIALPPRAGKSELGARRLIPYYLGRRPRDLVIFATYNDEFSGDMGRDVREVMQRPEYQALFPDAVLERGSASADRLRLVGGGAAVFVGRGGALTGRGMHLGVCDDLIKDSEEANSPTLRNKAWEWFTRVFLTRKMGDDARVLLIGTRWHEDDVQGRLTDPRNPCYDAEEAASWTILRIPAISEDEATDPLGRPKGEALWPSRFPIPFLQSLRRMDPQGFSALYQGRPTPEEGTHFKREHLRTYTRDQMPESHEMRLYVASDHAVSVKQRADLSCFMPAGVTRDGDLYILPDLVWERLGPEQAVAKMLHLAQVRKPIFWWAEKGHISQSIGPILRKRMVETGTYVTMDEVTPVKDKLTRSQAIHARMSMGRVFFPSFAPWWEDAKNELLTFPGGTHDDFVDALSLLGLKLNQQIGAAVPRARKTAPDRLTMGWVKQSSKQMKDTLARRLARRAW
jgi:predicted phage terminase large subunit-like protein